MTFEEMLKKEKELNESYTRFRAAFLAAGASRGAAEILENEWSFVARKLRRDYEFDKNKRSRRA